MSNETDKPVVTIDEAKTGGTRSAKPTAGDLFDDELDSVADGQACLGGSRGVRG